jgi:hypothetical protein
VDVQVELCLIALAYGCGRTRLLPADVLPPGAGRLTGQRDHGVDERHLTGWYLLPDERRGEPRHRLRDERDSRAVTDRLHDGFRVRGQPQAVVVCG